MRAPLLLAAALGLATPVLAQHAGHGAPPPEPPAEISTCEPEHAAMGHCSLAPTADPVDPNCPPEHAAMGHCTPTRADSEDAPGGSDPVQAPPVAPPPAEAFSGPAHAADAVFGAATMGRVRSDVLIEEHGGMRTGRVLIDRLEVSYGDGSDGYAWEADAWYGSDYNRLWFKTEGEGEFGHDIEAAEIQLLWSRPVTPFFDLQAGVRHDIEPDTGPAHLVLGIQGLAPYWFEVDAAAFLSDEGDLTARFEAEYDARITNQLILQPHAELELSAGDIVEREIGGGLSSVELGLRLRYQFVPEFAPYVGVSYERSFGGTADYARARGDEVAAWRVLVGLRTWF
ncbi:copper resistance protein B [Brevundimonas sp. 2R-24]|uniref:Copper resistance protein B n=1 Tax=Peiella sedimenti TaxID=3061083 RepID=A0ABT8SMG3_9CAUL|nr:copper resistance protein B [Caulobacteraceae bacterium XZ-24]